MRVLLNTLLFIVAIQCAALPSKSISIQSSSLISIQFDIENGSVDDKSDTDDCLLTSPVLNVAQFSAESHHPLQLPYRDFTANHTNIRAPPIYLS